MVTCGTYEELQTSGVDFAALLKEYEQEEEIDHVSQTGSVRLRKISVCDDMVLQVCSHIHTREILTFVLQK